MTLSNDEKNSLENIIIKMYGRDSSLLAAKIRYNEKTSEAVEKALEAAIACNSNIQNLLVSLIGGYKLTRKGWLKISLRAIEKALDSDRVRLDTFMCRVSGLRSWKTEILLSTY
jgi:hypothetical protein